VVRVVVPGPGDRLRLGPLELDLDVARASVAGTAIPFSQSELGLLALLVANPHRVLPRGFLADQLGFVHERTIDVMLVRLRELLGVGVIRTIRGRGWILDPESLAAGEPDVAMAELPSTLVMDEHLVPPDIPSALRPPRGNRVFLRAHAKGTLNYRLAAVPAPAGLAWALQGPDARLSDDRGVPIISHFMSPAPSGAPCVTWKHDDGSAAWGTPVAKWDDPCHVAPGATPWQLFRTTPGGDGLLEGTTFVQRLMTRGGLPPAEGRPDSGDSGETLKSPYTAEVFFWRAS
jgi:DNA-binding winged helix-turn-helix (wHTH) protein